MAAADEYVGMITLRRRSFRGLGITALSDYAHDPTELKAAHSALAASYPNRRLVAVF